MPPFVTPAIPANQLVNVVPSVLAAGGNALQLIGMILTQNTRVPIGQILQFPDATSVQDFFGSNSQEDGLATVYFNGFNTKTAIPAALNFTQYNIAPVAAYLWGGNVSSTLTLAALQALDGTLSIDINGTTLSGSVNLASATSFSNAAQIIAETLNIPALPVTASVVGSIATTTFTVTQVNSGTLAVGDVLQGAGITAGTYISALGTGTGGVGTYTLSASQTVSSETIVVVQPAAVFTGAIAATTLTVSAVASGTLAVGQFLSGAGVTSGTYISALGSGTGGTGTYTVSVSQSVSSESMTADASGVTYDSVTGAFVVTSPTYGSASTMAYATGTIASPLGLTQAAGAVLSAGANGNTPGSGAPITFMNAVAAVTQNWASFMTTWEPLSADKESFATWTNDQNDRYVYEMWDTNVANTESGGPSPTVAFITAGDLSGIDMIYTNPAITTLAGEKAAFQMGCTASINFNAINGRITFAFKGQAGLLADVTSATVANYLGGSPQSSSVGYGMNFYGDYTTANQAFIEWQRGFISGPWLWKDSYVNQIWLNAAMQLALMVYLQNVNSVPYAQPGYSAIEAVLAAPGGPIQQALAFGAIVPGVPLSSEQTQVVNAAAGGNVAPIITQQGWYLQVTPASAQTRANRSSPPITLWYADGGSIQAINLASITVQ